MSEGNETEHEVIDLNPDEYKITDQPTRSPQESQKRLEEHQKEVDQENNRPASIETAALGAGRSGQTTGKIKPKKQRHYKNS